MKKKGKKEKIVANYMLYEKISGQFSFKYVGLLKKKKNKKFATYTCS